MPSESSMLPTAGARTIMTSYRTRWDVAPLLKGCRCLQDATSVANGMQLRATRTEFVRCPRMQVVATP